MQLPSNKVATLFILVVLIVVLIITGDIFSKKLNRNGAPEVIDADLVLRRNTVDNSSGDMDGDGLVDWQETLYGSDPRLADTDGDGTNDGDEVMEDRDPTIAGPDDQLVRIGSILNTDFEVEGYTPGTLTDDFSKELFLNYLNLKTQNNLNSDSVNQLAQNLGDQVAVEVNPEIVYSESDLKIVSSNREVLKKYGEEIAIIYIDYLTQINNKASLPDEEYLIEASNLYLNLANVLSAIEIPDTTKNVHVELLNAVYNKALTMKDFANSETDPLKTLLSVKTIREADAKETEVLISLNNYFKDNAIIFTDNNINRFWNFYE